MATVPQKPSPAAHPAPAAKPKPKPHPRDSLREVVETVVFVVALVLMLKLFVVEAFVIPTGSMAETLYGYQKIVTCPECGYEYPVNSSNEVDPPDGVKRPVTGATCPNCRYHYDWGRLPPDRWPANRSGDRVLVNKALFSFSDPKRGQVVVFKFPVDPQLNHTAQNYIKRLWGLGRETIAVHGGDLYLCTGLDYPEDARDSFGQPKYPRPKQEDMDRLWEGPLVDHHSKTRPPYQSLGLDFTYHNADIALARFEESRKAGFPEGSGGRYFELIRKPDDLALSMRRIVFDNDHQSAKLAKAGVPPRWTAQDPGWATDKPSMPKVFTHSGGGFGWVRYLHRISAPATTLTGQQPDNVAPTVDDWGKLDNGWQEGLFPPSLITNFLGYNAGVENGMESRMTGNYWVGDLMVECTAKVSGPADEVVLELSKGASRYRARFAGGSITLSRVGPGGGDLVSKPTPITGAGTYDLRFANFDCRLRVWVNGRAIDFGSAAD